jgi:hypothetical protein
MATDSAKIRQAEQAILNGVYAAIAWLILDFGLLFQEHGTQTVGVILSRPDMIAGSVIVVACIAGLFYKSRTAASVIFLLFLVPQVLRAAQGAHTPPAMMIMLSLVLLYFFLAAVLGTFKYHALIEADRNSRE